MAIGPVGSGTRKVALELLAAAGVDETNATLLPEGGRPARALLEAGKLDAVLLLAVVYPLVKVLPEIFFWRQKNKIFKWYGELKFLEGDLARDDMPLDGRAKHLARLDEIEAEAATLHVPLAFSDRVYTLRGHIAYVRQNLTVVEKNISYK